MTKSQMRLYKKQFETEMAAMSVSEYLRWNPHMSEDEAANMIALAKASVAKHGPELASQQVLF